MGETTDAPDVERWVGRTSALVNNTEVECACMEIIDLMFQIRGADLKTADDFQAWVRRVQDVKVRLVLDPSFMPYDLGFNPDIARCSA